MSVTVSGPLLVFLLVLVVQRVIELVISARNARVVRSRGARLVAGDPFGWIVAICRCSHGMQAAISSGAGVRFPGGRHFRMFAMKTWLRSIPNFFSVFVSSWPARPTNGSPCRSSS